MRITTIVAVTSQSHPVLPSNPLHQFGAVRTQRLVLEAWDRLFSKK
jgi:hypothetical protein